MNYSKLKVFLEFDKLTGDLLVQKYQQNIPAITKRINEIKNLNMAYSTKSVHLFHDAKELYILGMFELAIIVCRSITEYLAQELFFEFVNIEGDSNTIIKLSESLSFRNIVNDFLFNADGSKTIIKKDDKDLFHKLYDKGNDWVHPKVSKQINTQKTAKEMLFMLRDLLDSTRGVFNEYYLEKGMLKLKLGIKQRRRPIKLN